MQEMHTPRHGYAPRMAGDRSELSLRDVRSFLAVVDEGTFTDAAIALGTTQASVSRHVAALEQALGARLLVRGGRVVTLTVAGRRVLRHARTMHEEGEAIRRAARDEHGPIRIGYAWAALGAHTAPVQRRWAELHPGSELVFVNSTGRFSGLNERLADVAVVRRDPGMAQIGTALLGHESRVAALPREHPLARRRSLRMADFAGRTVAVDALTGTTRKELWSPEQSPAGFRTVSGTDEWLTEIAAGQGIGLTSQATAVQYSRLGVVFRRVRDAPPLPVWLIWWRDDPPWYLDALRGLIQEEFDREG